jgi:hypothetical protein
VNNEILPAFCESAVLKLTSPDRIFDAPDERRTDPEISSAEPVRKETLPDREGEGMVAIATLPELPAKRSMLPPVEVDDKAVMSTDPDRPLSVLPATTSMGPPLKVELPELNNMSPDFSIDDPVQARILPKRGEVEEEGTLSSMLPASEYPRIEWEETDNWILRKSVEKKTWSERRETSPDDERAEFPGLIKTLPAAVGLPAEIWRSELRKDKEPKAPDLKEPSNSDKSMMSPPLVSWEDPDTREIDPATCWESAFPDVNKTAPPTPVPRPLRIDISPLKGATPDWKEISPLFSLLLVEIW